jgi:hypothetical protein
VRFASRTLKRLGPEALVAVPLVLAAMILRLGFLAEYPEFLMHEDSGPYVAEAERLLQGRETDGGVPARPPGYPLFLVFLLHIGLADLFHVVIVQHGLAVAGVLLLTIGLRMLGVRRLFAYGFFVAAAFSHRMIHYDNAVGAESLAFFLTATIVFAAIGMMLRRWDPWATGCVLAALAVYLLLVRSASFFLPLLIAAWIAIPGAHRLQLAARKRIVLAGLVALPPFMAYFAMVQWNKHHYGRAVLSREVEPVMAFAIGYSGDFTKGKFADLKREVRPVVEAGRAKLGPRGYPDISQEQGYQWVFDIFDVISVARLGSQQQLDHVVSGLFWETMLTPTTLYRHLTGHVWRELRFMLFDMTPVANAAVLPARQYGHFLERDTRNLRIAYVRKDRAPGRLFAEILPSPVGAALQHFTSRYIHINYHTEYKRQPGMIRLYAALSIALVLGLVVWSATLWRGVRPRNLPPQDSAALFVTLLWLGTALVTCTLLYALHRYSYYVLPFIAFTAFYGLDRLTTAVASAWRRRAPAISP